MMQIDTYIFCIIVWVTIKTMHISNAPFFFFGGVGRGLTLPVGPSPPAHLYPRLSMALADRSLDPQLKMR